MKITSEQDFPTRVTLVFTDCEHPGRLVITDTEISWSAGGVRGVPGRPQKAVTASLKSLQSDLLELIKKHDKNDIFNELFEDDKASAA